MSKKTVFLVDASTFIHRSYHAIRYLATSDGRPTNAVFGFVASLTKLIKEKAPEYLAVVYDAKGPSFRRDLYPEYKANRPPMPEDLIAQQEPIRRIVEAMGLRSLEEPTLEADDLVATLATKAAEKGWDVVIVSNDKDYFQVLSDRIRMYDPNPKKETEMTVEALKEKFGLTPPQFLEAQGLMGDSTDNIPGIPGVGEKTAIKLISEHGSLETLYDRLDRVSGKKLKENLAEHKDSALLSRELARLKTDAPLGLTVEDLAVSPPDMETLKALYQELEFTRFASELEPTQALDYEDYHLVQTMEDLENLIRELEGVDQLSVDLETTSVDPMRAEIVGMSLAAVPHRAFYIPMAHDTLGAVQLSWETVEPRIRRVLESERILKIGQNIKYDYIILKRHGLTLGPITDDPMIASYLLEPGSGGHNLDRLAKTYLGHDTIKYKEVVGGKNKGFETISPEAAREYACEDADVALILARTLRPRLEEAGLLKLYEELELPLIEVLSEMEMNGVRLDLELLADISKDLERQMTASEDRIYQMTGHRFNINSPKQLGRVLFEEQGLPQGKKTAKKTGYSTDVEVLTELAVNHELPAEVLTYRSLTKLRSTYVDALIQLVHPKTERVHTSFNQAVTATGRLSSSDPNLQNIPVRTPEGRRIREAFIADRGSKILSADYSQIELRVLAHYSGDQVLSDAFQKGEDVHTRTAAEVFGQEPSEVSSDLRRQAKAINFGIVYGLGAFGLAKQLGIERGTAQAFIDQYFVRYQGVKTFIDETLANARENGFVTTMLGRRRMLPELNSKSFQTRAMAERMAINTPIQGSAADLIKMAMLAVRRELKARGLSAKMILQVHDELVFEVPEEELPALTDLVRDQMENVVAMNVPLVVDISHGKNWSEAH